MAYSYAEHPDLTCPACNQPISAEVWLIIDLTEHPELIDRICADTLHGVRCPACDHVGVLDVPLLLYHPNVVPPLLFSPAQRTSEEQDREHAFGLMGKLRSSLGDAWHEEWLANGLRSVPRPELPATLGGSNPDA